jgi:hypothetical protein
MTPQQFAEENGRAKAILIGESHADANAAMVLNIVTAFENRGHNLSFYFEHFPGQVGLHEQLSRGQITPDAFMATPVDYPGANGTVRQTPEQYWGHPEQRAKLIALMVFAQERFIQVKGHDLVQRDFSPKGYQDWQRRRDMWMVHYMMSDLKLPRSGTGVAFIGQQHVRPQAFLLRQYLATPGAVVTLSPDLAIPAGQILRGGDTHDYTFRP